MVARNTTEPPRLWTDFEDPVTVLHDVNSVLGTAVCLPSRAIDRFGGRSRSIFEMIFFYLWYSVSCYRMVPMLSKHCIISFKKRWMVKHEHFGTAVQQCSCFYPLEKAFTRILYSSSAVQQYQHSFCVRVCVNSTKLPHTKTTTPWRSVLPHTTQIHTSSRVPPT